MQFHAEAYKDCQSLGLWSQRGSSQSNHEATYAVGTSGSFFTLQEKHRDFNKKNTRACIVYSP